MMNKWKYVGMFVFFALPLLAEAHTDITVQQAHAMIQNDPNIIVIDVREESEYCGKLGHLSGSDNYPYISGVFQKRYTDFGPNKSIILICHSGNRSNKAGKLLDSKGFLKVYDVRGGMKAWHKDYPTVGCDDDDKEGPNNDLSSVEE
ncbi:MAG: rhodanese-like domain-containing protein [Planctomycetota bacterium]|jgi:rhodanese-related sulfurtransferase